MTRTHRVQTEIKDWQGRDLDGSGNATRIEESPEFFFFLLKEYNYVQNNISLALDGGQGFKVLSLNQRSNLFHYSPAGYKYCTTVLIIKSFYFLDKKT